MNYTFYNNKFLVIISFLFVFSIFAIGIYIIANLTFSSNIVISYIFLGVGGVTCVIAAYRQFVSKLVINDIGIGEISGKNINFFRWEEISLIEYRGTPNFIINEGVIIHNNYVDIIGIGCYRKSYKEIWNILFNEALKKNDKIIFEDSFKKIIESNNQITNTY